MAWLPLNPIPLKDRVSMIFLQYGQIDVIAWLQRKLGNAARVEDVHPISERPQYFSGEGKNGKIQTVCFEGVLTINDAPALIDLLQQGIGPAKSMGCGLLSLAPL